MNAALVRHGELHVGTPAAEFVFSSVAHERMPRETVFGARADGSRAAVAAREAVVMDAGGRSLKCSVGGSLFVPAGVCSYGGHGTALLFRARVPSAAR